MKIVIKTKKGSFDADIDESLSPKTARAIIDVLPIEGRVTKWGDEVYFSIPVSVGSENAREEVEVGDLAYWPQGKAFCIFFGVTPVSTTEKPRAYSPVNIFGKIGKEGLEVLRKMRNGDQIVIKVTR